MSSAAPQVADSEVTRGSFSNLAITRSIAWAEFPRTSCTNMPLSVRVKNTENQATALAVVEVVVIAVPFSRELMSLLYQITPLAKPINKYYTHNLHKSLMPVMHWWLLGQLAYLLPHVNSLHKISTKSPQLTAIYENY